MDKTAFKVQTFEEADNHYGFQENKSTKDRLDAASYLICQYYKVTPSTKLDRTYSLSENIVYPDYSRKAAGRDKDLDDINQLQRKKKKQ